MKLSDEFITDFDFRSLKVYVDDQKFLFLTKFILDSPDSAPPCSLSFTYFMDAPTVASYNSNG